MMQVPPHRSLLEHHLQRSPGEAAKYVRTEYGENNPSWLLMEGSNKGRERAGRAYKKAVTVGRIAPEPCPHEGQVRS